MRHVDQLRQMLDCARSAEVQAIRITPRGSIKQRHVAKSASRWCLNQLADETRYKEELERIIAEWYEVASRYGN